MNSLAADRLSIAILKRFRHYNSVFPPLEKKGDPGIYSLILNLISPVSWRKTLITAMSEATKKGFDQNNYAGVDLIASFKNISR